MIIIELNIKKKKGGAILLFPFFQKGNLLLNYIYFLGSILLFYYFYL